MIPSERIGSILGHSRLEGIDLSANPYRGCAHGCAYCYASGMGGRDPALWGDVRARDWDPLERPERHAEKRIFIASATDAWQEAEAECLRTRGLLGQLAGNGRLLCVTKSPLICRDLDLIGRFRDPAIAFSVNTLDDGIREILEPHAPPIGKRIRAMRECREAGFRTICFIAPIIPGITRPREIVRELRPICETFWLDRLNLRGTWRPRLLQIIRKEFPGAMRWIGDPAVWPRIETGMREFSASIGMPFFAGGHRMSPGITCFFAGRPEWERVRQLELFGAGETGS